MSRLPTKVLPQVLVVLSTFISQFSPTPEVFALVHVDVGLFFIILVKEQVALLNELRNELLVQSGSILQIQEPDLRHPLVLEPR